MYNSTNDDTSESNKARKGNSTDKKQKSDAEQYHHDYANKHVPHVIFRTYDNDHNTSSKKEGNRIVQVLNDGSQLTVKNLVDMNHHLSIHQPILITDTPESIGMKVPHGKATQRMMNVQSDSINNDNNGIQQNENNNDNIPNEEAPSTKKINTKTAPITIREIGQKIGMDHPVSVMDVKTQDEMEGWNISDLVEYFEDEDRLYQIRQYNHNSLNGHSRNKKKFQQLKASKPRVLNQISLEFSNTVLKKDTMSPSFVRELDWIDTIWPVEKRYDDEGNDTYPRVQYYCLTSTAGWYVVEQVFLIENCF